MERPAEGVVICKNASRIPTKIYILERGASSPVALVNCASLGERGPLTPPQNTDQSTNCPLGVQS